MEPRELQRHQTIESLVARRTGKAADAAIDLWDRMATQIISIVGEGGFNSLYARSVFLTQSTFPWLVAGISSPQIEHRFTALKLSFEGQAEGQASAANSRLLINFTDILAALIGEELTTRILRSAWGNDVSNSVGKEFKNE